MSGAWEIQRQNLVQVAIIHTENTTVAWSLGLRNLIVPGPPIMCLAGMPFDHARNVAARHVKDNGIEWLFFLDSDVVPPHDVILRLVSHNRPLISGVYCRRSPPAAVPVMIRNGQWVVNYPANSIIEVDVVGSGCMLIHRSILESLPPQAPGKPWFYWKVDLAGLVPQGDALSEDFAFCVHVKRTLGIPTLVDTSIQCRHIGFAEARHGSFIPLETTPIT